MADKVPNRKTVNRITVQWRSGARQEEAQSVAQRLHARCVRGDRVPPGEYRIVFLEHGIELWDEHSRRHGFPVDFRSIDHRVATGSISRRQPLARALGRSVSTVIDATAGLGHDAFLMACLGWNVCAVERHPLLSVLLEYCLRDAQGDEQISSAIGDRLCFHEADARDFLVSHANPVDVVYLDPMFHPRKSTALPRKPAQILRQLVQPSDDDVELVKIARQHARKRVVVKRHDQAEPIHPDVDQSYSGKMVRYDVYLSDRTP